MYRRVWGTVMMMAAIVSLVITLFLLVEVWRLVQPATDAAEAGANLVGATLDTTTASLDTVKQSLDSTSTQVENLDQLSQTLAQSMHDTAPLLDSLKTLTGKDLPSTLQATEQSLTSAQSSARVVDGVLSTLTRIPFLPVQPYQPNLSLESAFGQVNNSLNALNAPLESINQNLNTTSGDMADMESRTRAMSQNIQGVKRNIADLNQSVAQYRQTALTLRTEVNELESAIPGLVILAALILSFILAWLVVSQVDMLVRGYALVRASSEKEMIVRTAGRKRVRNFESEEV